MPNCRTFESVNFIFLLSLSSICDCLDLLPMPCNVSLADSCPASLYYVPPQPTNTKDVAFLFNVPSDSVRKTADGFLIRVTCVCPAEHEEFVWHTAYLVRFGDTWKLVSGKFGLLVMENPRKVLVALTNITLDFLCGCVEGAELVTYTIQHGDTLYIISLRFGVSVEQIRVLNKVVDESMMHVGDRLFIPAKADLLHLVLPDDGSNAQRSSKVRAHTILGISIAAISIILILVTVLLWIYYKRRLQKQHVAFLGGTKRSPFSLVTPRLKSCSTSKGSKGSLTSKPVKTNVFSYSEVCDGTSDFSESHKIGQGSHGCVVAIKKMKTTKSKEFFAELNILCEVNHRNLIELIGYSSGEDSLCLVYKFAQNGALSDHLHNPAAKGHKPLTWSLRVQIALDAAKGLEHLHVHIKQFYAHRDVKPSNILLDSNFHAHAKIADFGLVKLLEHSPEFGALTSKIIGTFGYLAPEFARDGCVSPKADGYAYGVILMDLITGQPALIQRRSVGDAQYLEHQSLIDFVLRALQDAHDPITRLLEIVNVNLIDYHKDSLLQMALLSKDCIDDDWKRCPNMSQVVHRLSQIARSMECN